MAQYRLAAQVIGRSAGRSATAAAAYRAGVRIVDERTGLVHDYTRREGVVHAEIVTPENAPDWMADRAALWNAVEAVEKRRDAQLARELQLSLPHELSADQRVELVRSFLRETFASEGMIADFAIHAPDRDGDARNHHAHVLLTMRDLMGEGFGKKNRDWNDDSRLQEWRAAWAAHQNRAFERLGIAARVDHRSLEDQGIDREPQKHQGPIATEIERDGRASFRGAENREIIRRNHLRAELGEVSGDIDRKIDFEKRKFAAWAARKHVAEEFDARQRRAQFDVGLAARMAEFERQLVAEFGGREAAISQEKSIVSDRLGATGWRKFIRDLTLTTRRDRLALAALERDAEKLAQAQAAERGARLTVEENRRRAAEDLIARRRAALERGVEKARLRREEERWAGPKDPIRPGFADAAKAPAPDLSDAFNRAAAPQEAVERDEEKKGDNARRQADAAQRASNGREKAIGEDREKAANDAPPLPSPDRERGPRER
jgi:ATP-dependent exoDNAse (exonuclease V) alpha subunit